MMMCVCVCVCVIFVIFLWEDDPPAHRDGRSQVDEDILHIGYQYSLYVTETTPGE